MAGASRARTVREEKQFTEDKKKLKHSAKRLDEILFGVIWTLSRIPESFGNVSGTMLYLAKTDAAPDAPSLYIWYTFDDDYIYLLSVELAPAPE